MSRDIKDPVEFVPRGMAGDGWGGLALREKEIPFKPPMDVPSRETLEAMKEIRRILAHPENYKGMTVDEALKALDV